MTWRSYIRCCKLEEDYAEADPELYETLYAREEKHFVDQFMRCDRVR